jgi:hypothetical protein
MEIIGWILWAIVFFFCVAGLIFLKRGLKTGLMGPTIASIINQWLLLLWSFFMPDFNKIHLLWLFPLTYVLNFGLMFLVPIWHRFKLLSLLGPVGIFLVVLTIIS